MKESADGSGLGAAGILLTGKRKIHMMGIGGVGMSGLAVLLRARGHDVSGCDETAGLLTEALRTLGISVSQGHSAEHILTDIDCVIRSGAVAADHPEVRRAEKLGIPVVLRGEAVAGLSRVYRTIAVTGTHGKTTTTSMLCRILMAAGRDPNCLVGGWDPNIGGVARVGGGMDLVVEADESDGTVKSYRSTAAVITNMEYDHLDYYGTPGAMDAAVEAFMAGADKIVYNGDDPNLVRIADHIGNAEKISFSLGNGQKIRGEIVNDDGRRIRMETYFGTDHLGTLDLPVGGLHNAQDALAACAGALAAGVDFGTIQDALSGFKPVARRFEIVVNTPHVKVVTDYAHHPSEIRAVLATARKAFGGRLLVIFQPHRYSRTRRLAADFVAAFNGVDYLVLTPVYSASEKVVSGGSTHDLHEKFVRAGCNSVVQADSLETAWRMIVESWHDGDTIILLGAGDIAALAEEARRTFAGEKTG